MPGFAPTAEQQKALDLFRTGESMVIEAGAGTGKTSTLKLLAESTDRRGQYIAFNKAIVTEAGQKMPSNIACHTAHALAYREVGKHFGDRLRNSQRMRSSDIAAFLGLDPLRVVTYTGEKKYLSPSFLAGVAMRGIGRFCQSADERPVWQHVPRLEGLDDPMLPKSHAPVQRAVAQHVEEAMVRAWADLTRYQGTLPYRHDHYLKTWQLNDPKIAADFILFDEAQDANPVMVDIVARQKHAQLVWVGDSQQQIYTFTGAVNALQQVPATHRTFLTQSFRFGEAVATVANGVLEQLGAELRLRGFDEVSSEVRQMEEPEVVLTRTNAAAMRVVMDAIQSERKVHLVGGGSEIASFARAAGRLMGGQRVEHPELACFESWQEVCEYVAQDEQGGELRLLVGLINQFGVSKILQALDGTVTEAQADLIVSTAHKSKGREWDLVQLGSDFPADPEGEELRLLYVAVTRARLVLDIEAVQLFKEQV